MAEQSYPIVEQPMSADQWKSVTLGIGNGILDEGGFPYRLKNLSNATNTGVLQAASRKDGETYSSAILNGFYHRLEEDLELEFPAVTSRTTYHVTLQYDPSRTDMPVQAKVVTSLDYSQGKNYLTLYTVTRGPDQLLTDAAVRMMRPRVAPVQVYARESDMPEAHKVLWGTLALVHNGRAGNNAVLKMAITGDDAESDNGWFWKTIYDPNDNGFVWDWKADSGTYTNPGSGYVRAIGRRGRERRLRGRVSLVSGNVFQAGGTYNVMGTGIPPEDAPGGSQRFVTACGNATPTFATVEVSPDGSVTASTSHNTYWIGLDGIEWEAK